MRAAGGVLGHVRYHLKAVRGEEGAGVVRIEARVVEGLALPFAHRHPRAGAGDEEERRAGRGVVAEDSEHRPLVVGAQVKEAIPGQDSLEARAEAGRAHVAYDPARVREAAFGTARSSPAMNRCR